MKMLKAKEVAILIGYSPTELYRKVSNGSFPKGKKMGAATRWPDYIAVAWSILYWELNEPLPTMAEETLREVRNCVEIAKQSLSA
jgi:hypothetical protein